MRESQGKMEETKFTTMKDKDMKPLINKQGITIKQLKEFVKDLPEQDQDGNDFELWVMNTDGTNCSNVATDIWQLNGGDLIVEIDEG